MAQNSALTKRELPNGDVMVNDTINGASHRYTKAEYDGGVDKGLHDGPSGGGKDESKDESKDKKRK